MAATNDYSDVLRVSPIPKKIGYGHSFFRPLPDPRHCGSLRIPYEFCLCKKEFLPELNKKSATLKRLANFATSGLMSILEKDEVADKCEILSPLYNKTTVTPLVNPDTTSSAKLFKINLVVTPGEGEFEGYLSTDDTNQIELISKGMTRMDSYGDESACIADVAGGKPQSAPICLCRKEFMPTTAKP
ncbi:hypothetical protein L596_012157 [Steinernema carpocapsae]|uniref:Uncharacterized protein n=1 Tax=Steinernema carpocapsae TaxID=34508 RepID=A0A4U5NWF5_STECR|nr:hypothetical protein L596_012157 [Steinernema carpocapsae]